MARLILFPGQRQLIDRLRTSFWGTRLQAHRNSDKCRFLRPALSPSGRASFGMTGFSRPLSACERSAGGSRVQFVVQARQRKKNGPESLTLRSSIPTRLPGSVVGEWSMRQGTFPLKITEV